MADEVDPVEVFDVSDIVERAVKTALEVGIAAVPFVLITDVSKPALVAAGISAGSAFLSVVVNAVQQYARSKKSHVQL
jgi:predicted DsbA family dithiol-disulfide isomerase